MSETAVAGPAGPSAVDVYKGMLRAVLDTRPSGTRQRLADALGKNRSFVSQIANPNYPVPIPAQHLQTIFDICHFSASERHGFIEVYRRAHPGRLESVRPRARERLVSLLVPDLHDTQKNAAVDEFLGDVARRLAKLIEDISNEPAR
jgi:hypothetical protein